jgi:DNA-binding NarL/FixJ family response regulator
MGTSASRIVLVDEHRSFIELLATRIDAESDLTVVGIATNVEEAMQIIRETNPDVVTSEVELPGRGAFDGIRDLKAANGRTKIVFLTGHTSEVFVEQALQLRARGYLLKQEPAALILRCLRRVVVGEYCFSDEIRQRLVFDAQQRRYRLRSASQLSTLTARQFEVLRLLANGHSVKEVANRMHLSHKSIDNHKYRIMHKLGIRDRVKLARYAIREGLTIP